ncbi:L,D-transpeptidase [Ensifer sp. P24N7]|uniref:L,D-transpeptidase n=1 Tax=Sinorhizobium sp. P24N7 TaxID=3348358 RepID=UPI0035F34D52
MHGREVCRRSFLKLAAITALLDLTGRTAALSAPKNDGRTPPVSGAPAILAEMYGERPMEPHPVPAVPYQKIDPRFHRQVVDDPTGEPPGTLVVDVGNHFLYLAQVKGQALRYGVALGRAGFEWSGRGVVQYKRKWPRWIPADEMIEREPKLKKYSLERGGMEPGPDNPLGARALYIFQNGEDTLYRVHGSPEWWTIGQHVSSGCVRMINQDVMDLYNRVPDGSPILVADLSKDKPDRS